MTGDSPVLRPMGTRSVLVELPDTPTVMAWHAHLSEHPLRGQLEVIAAANTVLLKTDTRRALDAALETLPTLRPQARDTHTPNTVEVEVRYRGEDLDEVAAHYGISVDALIDRHTSETWRASFGGFAPGFAYCSGEQHTWDTPRRSSPRTRVPRGSVALAGPFSAIYPLDSPGGWQLIGVTAAPVWDDAAEPPNLFNPGDVIRYRAVTEQIEVPERHVKLPDAQPARPAATVTAAGLQTLFQDCGRVGHGDAGVSTSGALDRAAARQANRIVGNPSQATVIECLLGGFGLRANIDLTVAVTGADVPVTVGERAVPSHAPVVVPAGSTLEIGAPSRGIRSYVAVRGGWVTGEVMGSSATDTLSRLGPAPIEAGQTLKIPVRADVETVGAAEPSTLPEGDLREAVLRVVPGPRDAWCAPGELDTLTSQRWEVSRDSNRVALRLRAAADGRPLRRAENTGELASEGMVSGAIQVPPEGQPVLFLADHPVTGGYPVIATVVAEDLDLAAQLPPGATIRFCLFE